MFKVYLERMNKYEINHVSHFHWNIKLLFVFKVSLEFDPECYNYLVFISEFQYISIHNFTWVKGFKNGPTKICWRHPLKYLKWYGLLKQIISLQFFWRLSSTNVTWSILETLTHLLSTEDTSYQFWYLWVCDNGRVT